MVKTSHTQLNEFHPDTIPHPGESLREYIMDAGMSIKEFTQRTGWTEQHIHKILREDAGISPEFALVLEKVFQVPARFWNNMQNRYDEFVAHKKEQAALAASLDWARAFPYSEMVKLGWIRDVGRKAEAKLDELLKFFAVANPAAFSSFWDERIPAFRASGKLKSDPNAVACWIRKAELEALNQELPAYDKQRFTQAIAEIRQNVTSDLVDYQHEMKRLCREAGVLLIFLPHLPKMNVGGVTFWLRSKGIPVIVLSLRWNSDDHIWFNFFHEAKHVQQEMKKRLFVDLPGDGFEDPKEKEAIDYAANLLIPKNRFKAFCAETSVHTPGSIRRFAESVNVTPGVVLGQLQHCGEVAYGGGLESLKRRFIFSDKK